MGYCYHQRSATWQLETAEKEAQETSRQWSGCVPHPQLFPHNWGQICKLASKSAKLDMQQVLSQECWSSVTPSDSECGHN